MELLDIYTFVTSQLFMITTCAILAEDLQSWKDDLLVTMIDTWIHKYPAHTNFICSNLFWMLIKIWKSM
jgi:hypothetical protein